MILWTIAAWIIFAYTAVRVSSLVSSAFWLYRQGDLFVTRVENASGLFRYDKEYLWSQIVELGGGPRPWRPFGIRSQWLEVNAIRAKLAGKRSLSLVLKLTRLAWKWQISAIVLSSITILAAVYVARTMPSIVLPLELVVVLLLAGSIAIVVEAIAATGQMGGWAWVYHRRLKRRNTPDSDLIRTRAITWSETNVVLASAVIALVTVAQAVTWIWVVVKDMPSADITIPGVLLASLLTLFGNVNTITDASWIASVAAIEVVLIDVAYVFLIFSLALKK